MNVVVRTPVGNTEGFSLHEIILQGSVFAPIKCSIQVETLSKDCTQKDGGSSLYKYKEIVFIPPLSIFDDVLTVSKCGSQSLEMNAILNSKMESKKLRLSADKCYQIHISKKKTECRTTLKVHDSTMKKVTSAVYLGDVVSESSSINATVKAREAKSIGIINQISLILKNVSLGMFHFRTAFILRDSIFINGLLTNVESWYHVSERNVKTFYDADIKMFSSIFETSLKVNHVLYFIETAKLPIRQNISKRHLMFLREIMSRLL